MGGSPVVRGGCISGQRVRASARLPAWLSVDVEPVALGSLAGSAGSCRFGCAVDERGGRRGFGECVIEPDIESVRPDVRLGNGQPVVYPSGEFVAESVPERLRERPIGWSVRISVAEPVSVGKFVPFDRGDVRDSGA